MQPLGFRYSVHRRQSTIVGVYLNVFRNNLPPPLGQQKRDRKIKLSIPYLAIFNFFTAPAPAGVLSAKPPIAGLWCFPFAAAYSITLFVNEIVPAANIKVRFAGTEPLDTVTNQYNRTMEAILSQHGIWFEEVSRIEKNGEVISASRVRKLLESRDWELIQELVPDTTLSYLKGRFPL